MATKPPEEPKSETKSAAEMSLDDKIAAAVERAMAASMPVAMAAVATILKPKEAAVAAIPEWSPSDRCTKCLQFRAVCKDKHELMNVHPANPRRYSRFPGITVNGVTYISPRIGAPIWVPKENDITYKLQRYEEEEENLREGHSLTHNSGTLSPHASVGNTTHQANPMGFRGMNHGAPQ